MNAATTSRLALCGAIAVLMGLSIALTYADEMSLEARSGQISDAFGKRLKTELQAAMSQGGPANAVDVCKEQAPRIAAALSRESGAKVRRTSLRFRNPGNAPEPWEAQVLRDFDNADNPDELTYFEASEDGVARYMRAIPTAPLCLACHGEQLDPSVAEMLAREYPHDRATGYRAGEIRGAFSISWPATTPMQ